MKLGTNKIMNKVIYITKRLITIRKNHIFCFCKSSGGDFQIIQLPDEYQVFFPYDLSRLTPAQFAGGIEEYNYLEKQFCKGNKLGVVLYKNVVAHRSLLQTYGIVALEGDIHALLLKPHSIYIHGCETNPEHKGKSLYPAMLAIILESLIKRGDKKEALIACRQNNVPSIRGILKAGFSYKCSTISISLFGNILSHSFFYITTLEVSNAKNQE